MNDTSNDISDISGLVAFIDFETTGLDPNVDKAVEFACVLYCPTTKRYITSEEYIFNVYPDDQQKAMLDSLCQIDDRVIALSKYAKYALNDFDRLLCFELLRQDKIFYFIAHNAAFDAAFLQKLIPKALFESISWIDSMNDYPFDAKVRSKSLSHIAADYGFLNPFAHRALSDCLTLMEITKRMDWTKIVDYANQPSYLVQSLEPFEKKDEVKKAGFNWNPEKKAWFKKMRQAELDKNTLRIKVIESYYASCQP
jgi:DNA polymerase III alpha subunit (gram-positive type)